MNLNERVLEGELMDAPDLAANLHHSALKGLQRVNRFSGTARVLCKRIQKQFGAVHAVYRDGEWRPEPLRSADEGGLRSADEGGLRSADEGGLRILDLACGGGDVTVAVAQQLRQAGIQANVEGWDRSSTAIDYANENYRNVEKSSHGERQRTADLSHGLQPMVQFRQHEFADLNVDGQYDVVMCTLFLHHLNRTEAVDLLARMYRASRGIVLVDDLRRTWIGYRLAQLGCQLLSRSRIVHVDGPLSVRAAFTESEVEQLSCEAGLPVPQISRHWPQRFLACWQRTSS